VHRLLRHLALLGTAALIGLAPLTQAAAPKVETQVPGYYRTALGQFEITALYDDAIEIDGKLLKNAGAADLQRPLSRMFVGNPKM